ncbi:hypothetical protein A7982_12162 [Minicystis rosea]|nr:hypothetical protein A7982_12162 [Minicystis rosea]
MRGIVWFMVAAAALAGCAKPAQPPVPVVELAPEKPAPSVTSATPTPSKEPPRDACAPFNDAARDDLVSKIPRRDDFSPDWFAEHVCVATPRGLWAIAYDHVKVTPVAGPSADSSGSVEIDAPWSLVHVDAAGKRTAMHGGTLHIASYRAADARVFEPFDYDGDGDDEVLLRTSHGSWSAGESEGHVMTARGGTVTRYAPAASIDVAGVEDVDGDGRPDLLTFGPYRPETQWCSFEPDPAGRVELVAHALPGGDFSLKDAAASAFAKRACPAKPTALTVDKFDAGSMTAVRCARLWGRSEAEAVRAIRRTCTGQLEQCGQHGKGNCLHFDAMMAWAKATPPLQLTP